MTSALRISSEGPLPSRAGRIPARLVLGLVLLAATAAAGTVTGTVQLTDSRDPGVRKRRDYSGVVVWLDPTGSADNAASRPHGHARMEQRGKTFIPHVLAISAGTSVEFPNFDPVFHSAFSNFSGQMFDLGLYAPGTTKTITFSRTGVVRVFCNIHPTMSAVIVVVKYPWFAVSRPSGEFAIQDVPPGDYVLRVFHERASQRTLQALERRFTVTAEGLSLGRLAISETGYIEAPHKNKYDQDYPPVPGDEGVYTDGGRKK